jgi:hypothetical protein
MRIQRSWVLCVLTIMALVIAVHRAHAQSYPYPGAPPMAGGYPGMPAQVPYGYQPAAYYDPAQGAAPQQLGASPAMPTDGPVMNGDGMGQPLCGACGGYGCEQCVSGSDDFDLKLLKWLLPYGAGGCGTQRWYDASAEWVSLQRDEIGASTVFATEDIAGVPVLGTDQLNFSDRSGVRVSVALQLGAGNNIESTYLGGFNWASQAEARSNDRSLYSIMSNYGQSPYGGFTDTDQANLQRIEYSSELNSVELNYRQRWVGPNVRVQGSWLAGVRYLELAEDFRYLTVVPPQLDPVRSGGTMDYLVGTTNSLTGAQAGGDLWICITPGVNVGAEAKLGIYGNHAMQRTVIRATSIVPPLLEREGDDAVAFAGDFNVSLLWRISQNWTFRSGYMFLWADQVALASNNFNPGQPEVTGSLTPRTTFINNSSDVFYHGFTAGLEYMW